MKKKYTLSAAALEQRRQAAKRPKTRYTMSEAAKQQRRDNIKKYWENRKVIPYKNSQYAVYNTQTKKIERLLYHPKGDFTP